MVYGLVKDGVIENCTPALQTAIRTAATVLEKVLLPALMMTPANPAMSFEVWEVLKLLPYEVRSLGHRPSPVRSEICSTFAKPGSFHENCAALVENQLLRILCCQTGVVRSNHLCKAGTRAEPRRLERSVRECQVQ